MATNSKNILYAKSQTKDNYYIYNAHSNDILQVSKVNRDIIDDYFKDHDDKAELFEKHSQAILRIAWRKYVGDNFTENYGNN